MKVVHSTREAKSETPGVRRTDACDANELVAVSPLGKIGLPEYRGVSGVVCADVSARQQTGGFVEK